jgi:hypothetical protein
MHPLFKLLEVSMTASSGRIVSLADIDAAVAQAREARSQAVTALLLAIPALFARAAGAVRDVRRAIGEAFRARLSEVS